MDNRITLVSIGRHTRLGDVLEHALEGLPFQTIDIEALVNANVANARLLFAASADDSGENERMRRLAARLCRGEGLLDGAVCAMVADGEQGGSMRIDALRLLLAANGAGAACPSRPLLESGRELSAFSQQTGKERKTPFERYCALAKELTACLMTYNPDMEKQRRFRFAASLTGGTAKDWRAALSRWVADAGGELTEEPGAEDTILLAENTTGLPDERTLALLRRGSGRLYCLIASPSDGGDLYALNLLDQACVRGGYALAPEGMLVFEGKSAVEALASRAETERVKTRILRLPD